MEEKKLIKANISQNLPYGALSKIARAIKAKTGKNISVKQVANICDPTKRTWNADVIAEAQELIIEEKYQVAKALEKTV